MGFSISGSAAIIFAGLFISFGIFYGAASNSFELVSDAQSEQADAVIEQKNTDIEIVVYEYDPSTNRLTVLVNNTGARTLSLGETDLIVDNEYRRPTTEIVESGATATPDTNTDLWQPGEQVRLVLNDVDTRPTRLKVVSEHGVSDSVSVGDETRVVL